MRVLVTGGAGFIGSHLVDAYVAAGHEVAVIDDMSTGRRENLNLVARKYELDICDPGLDRIIARERPQLVAHLAAQIDVRRSVEDPEADIKTNLLGTVRVALACARHGVGTLVFASTGGAIYGEPEPWSNSVAESHPEWPLSPYGIDKYAAELYLRRCERVSRIRIRILRLANVYGPRQDSHGEAGVVAIFAGQMLAGKRPTIYGDGSQQRDFVYVADVVDAFLRAPSALWSGPINIGTGLLTSVSDLFRLIASETGYAGEPSYAEARQSEVRAISLDASLAKKTMGWEPRTTLAEGIGKTVEYPMKEQRGKEL